MTAESSTTRRRRGRFSMTIRQLHCGRPLGSGLRPDRRKKGLTPPEAKSAGSGLRPVPKNKGLTPMHERVDSWVFLNSRRDSAIDGWTGVLHPVAAGGQAFGVAEEKKA